MPSIDLMELASRVEAGEGPNRELDAAIWLHLPEQEGHAWKHGGDRYKHAHQIAGCSFVPAYTGNLEAAITLVPTGWWWSTGNCSVSADASVGPDVAHCDKETLIRFDAGIHCDLPHPSTPALALCCAALRARAHQGAAHVEQ